MNSESKTGSKKLPSYLSKLCPILSLVSMKSEPSRLQIPGGGKPAQGGALACQGGACMFFIPEMDMSANPPRPNGDGICAVTMYPIAINQQTALMHSVAEGFADHLGIRGTSNVDPISDPAIGAASVSPSTGSSTPTLEG